jgi:hypothetical protein
VVERPEPAVVGPVAERRVVDVRVERREPAVAVRVVERQAVVVPVERRVAVRVGQLLLALHRRRRRRSR